MDQLCNCVLEETLNKALTEFENHIGKFDFQKMCCAQKMLLYFCFHCQNPDKILAEIKDLILEYMSTQ